MSHVGVALLRRVEDHAEVVEKPGLRGGFGVFAEFLCFGFVLFFNVGEDLWEEVDDTAPGRRGGVGEDESGDVLGVSGAVGHGEHAAVGVADECDFAEAELVADGF